MTRSADAKSFVPDLARKPEISLGAYDLTIDPESGIGLSPGAGAITSFSLSPVALGDTGLVLEASGISISLDPNNPPSGKPVGWRGCLLGKATIYLPESISSDEGTIAISLSNASIGSDGISGDANITWNADYDSTSKAITGDLVAKLGGFTFALESVSISLLNNALTAASIQGLVQIPYLDQALQIDLGLTAGGDLTVGISSNQPTSLGTSPCLGALFSFDIPNVAQICVQSLDFAIIDGLFISRLGGDLTPLYGKDQGLDWPSFHVDELFIDSQGNVRIDGGWLNLTKQYAFEFFAFQFEITKLGFGQTDDGGKWIGFSGGIKLVEGLPAGVSVEGLRISWYPDGHTSFTFNGIGLEFSVPAVMTFKGAVAYNTLKVGTNTIHRFDGTIKLKLIPLDMEIDAVLVVGSSSGPEGTYTFFAIYLGVELPAGIPIFQTGLALYGMAGLFAYQMEPNKGAAPNILHPTSSIEEGWYENEDGGPGWYKRGEVGVTDLKTKWDPVQGSLAFGVGATLGTLPDNGMSFHGKFLLVIVFPGPIIMLEGRGDMLKKRADQDGKTKTVSEPLFRAVAILDGRLGTLTIGMAAQYRFNENGALIDISGSAEAFYDFNNPDAWHIYMGRDEPREHRVHAYIFKKFFEANAYFMLDSAVVQTGAWVSLKAGWNFGLLSAKLDISLDGQAKLSRKPPHFYGHLLILGHLDLNAFGFGATINLEAEAVADVYDPFHLRLDLRGELKLPWPLPSFKVDRTKEWGPELVPPLLPLLLKEIAIEHLKVTTSWPMPRDVNYGLLLPNYDSDGDDFLKADNAAEGNTQPTDLSLLPVIPLDARPHITFGRSVHDDAFFSVTSQPVLPNADPPGWERIGDPTANQGPVRARYGLKAIALHKLDQQSRAWMLVARKGTTGVTADDTSAVPELFGSWAPVPDENCENIGQTKLWLWSKTSFDYTHHGGHSWNEWFAGRFPFYPCIPPALEREICCDFADLAPGQKLQSPWTCPDHPEITLIWSQGGDPVVTVLDQPVDGLRRALCFPGSVATTSGGSRANQIKVEFGRPGKNAKITPAGGDGHGGSLVQRCLYFQGRAPGRGPTTEQQITFTTQGAPGTSIMALNGVSGLNCGGTLAITLPRPCLSAELTLTSQSVSPGNARNPYVAGHSRTGAPQASAQMRGASQTETLRLKGRDIIELTVHAQGETVLNQLCLVYVPIDGTASDEGGNIYPGLVGAGGILEIKQEGLSNVTINGGDQTCIVKVCVTLAPEQSEVARREAMAKHFQDALARWTQQGDLLESHTTYRLKVVTSLVAIGEGELDGYKQNLTETEYSFFRTQGPPGMARLSLPPGSLPRDEDLLRAATGEFMVIDSQGKTEWLAAKPDPLPAGSRFVLKNALNDLSPYVRQTIPATVPAPGQPQPLPRPVYRAYDTGVEFNEDYVDLMYRQQRRGLALYLFDSNNLPARDAKGRLIVLENRWGETEDLNLNEGELLWIARLNANNCGELDHESISRDRTLTTNHAGLVLDPDNVYEARLTPLLLDEDFTTDLSGWQVEDDEFAREKPSDWTVKNHKQLSGTSATITSSANAQTVVKLDGSPDLTKLNTAWDILILAADTERSSHRYRIVSFNNGADTVTVDGLAKFSGTSSSSAWEIPGLGALVQTSSINGGSEAGLLDGRDPVKPATMLLRGDSTWTDYRLSVTLGSSDWGAIGVVFRASDPTHYYRFSMAGLHKYRRLVRVQATVHRVLAEDHFVFQQNHDYRLIIEVVGPRLRIYLDGDLVFEVTDTALDHGGMGLYCWNNSGARFTNLRVDDFRKEAAVIYRYKFTTSRFADFFHHLHSFQDETWVQNTQVDLTLPAEASNLSSVLTEGEGRAYDTLIEKVLGAAAYQEPAEVQVTRLEKDGNAVLLVQSPEPIDIQRTSIELEYTSRPVPIPAVPSEVKLTDVTFGTAQPNQESVSLLLREAVDLSGYCIEQMSFPSSQSEPADTKILFSDSFNRQPAGLLFEEQFGGNALDHYTIIDEKPPGSFPSSWVAADDRIEQRGNYRGGTSTDDLLPTHPGTIALLNSGNWSNVRIRAVLNTGSLQDIGIVFRYQDEENYYRFSISRNVPDEFARLVKNVGGIVQVLWEDDKVPSINQSCRLVIETFDDRLTIYLDDALQLNLRDPDFASGQVGLYCWGNALSYFEGLEVEALGSDPLLWEPPFQTLDEVTLVEEDNAVDGPAVWQVQNGVLKQSSKILALEGTLQVMPGAAHDIALGLDGFACVIGTDPTPGGFGIYIWTGNGWDRIAAPAALRIAAGPDKSLMWVDDTLHIFSWHTGNVRQLPWQARDISVIPFGPAWVNGPPAESVWIVGSNSHAGGFMIYAWDGIKFIPKGLGALRIALGPDGNAWVVDDAHRIFRWDGNTWQPLPGEANDIAVSADGTAWIVGNTPIGADFGIYRWDGHVWQAMAGSAVAIAVDPYGRPWLVDSNRRILRWSGNFYHQPGTYALGGDPKWQDVQLSVKLRSDSDGAIGVMFRYQDGDNYYRFSMDRKGRYRRLIKKVGGVLTLLWEDNWLYTQAQSYELTLQAVGSDLRGYIDGEAIFTSFDSDLGYGKVGLYCRGNDAAHFERVVVADRTRRIGRWTIHDEGDQDAPSVWQSAGGALQQISTIHDSALDDRGTYAVAGDSSWTDYRFSVRLRSDEPGAIGVLFRYVDRDHYYRFSMEQTKDQTDPEKLYRRLIKKAGGQVDILWQDKTQGYTVGDVYTLTVEAHGSELAVYLGDTSLFLPIDDSAYPTGQIGLYCANNGGARFEYVEVSAYPSNQSFDNWMLNEPFNELLSGRWSFVDKGNLNGPSAWKVAGGNLIQTSNIRFNPRFPGVDSNQPATLAVAGNQNWTDYRFSLQLGSNFLFGGNVQSIGVLFRYQDAENYYRFTLDYIRGFALLESRVGGQVKILWQGNTSPAVGQIYNLSIDCLGPVLRSYLDGRRLFEVEDSSLASGQVGLACTANPVAFFNEVRVAAPIWRLYYTFREEERRSAGTRLQVFSGNRRDATALEEGVLQRFVAAPGEAGRLHFPPDSVDLRLRAPDGKFGHMRRFLPLEDYAAQAAQDWRILRKADGTGFFLFNFKTTSTLAAGQYRLTLKYKRDNRSKEPDSQVFSKAGDTGAETVTLDIPWRTA